ncbi:hypothetical protein MFUM_370006 [Methylacidiphilum fumariolicum SolV]|uniref:Uncharacterized protein n=2 Tax=Candidatus Methylacidiphilum fumarolicum TaxID=591154 RepID=I0JY25_METFB|nr:hypothetical protein [Candidatus Methylacidiphilum fumarolicum]CCG92144.1 hypothetical protein MFUM_370006 [Methylacidiphilum fumariolicum SolV]
MAGIRAMEIDLAYTTTKKDRGWGDSSVDATELAECNAFGEEYL